MSVAAVGAGALDGPLSDLSNPRYGRKEIIF